METVSTQQNTEQLIAKASRVKKPRRFPVVIASIVIRAANKGNSHGAVYLVDLDTGRYEQKIDFNTTKIDWSGSGGERGLRGIAFYEDKIFLTTHNEIVVYDKHFQLVESIGNPYLGQAHEIYILGNILWITSTSFDSILAYDLKARRFTKGYCIRALQHRIPDGLVCALRGVLRASGWRDWTLCLNSFDPNSEYGPNRADDFHINNVFAEADTVYVSPGRSRELLGIRDDQLFRVGRIPSGTHNARPYQDAIIVNNSYHNEVALIKPDGTMVERFPVIRYNPEELLMNDLSDRVASPNWARGLCFTSDGFLIGGSSPATISIYQHGQQEPVKTVNISKDIRYAIHGLELWPFGD